MAGNKKLLFVLNPVAGKALPRGPLFDAACTLSDGGYLLRLHETVGRNDATELVRQCGSDFDVILCSGGDGTLNETLSGLMALEVRPPLAYLPRGSTNDFAASLGLSGDPKELVNAVLNGQARTLDVGLWNNRYFAYVASFGAFTRASYAASQAAKNALGHFAYILEGMMDITSLRPWYVSGNADGEHFEGEFIFGAVSNSTSIGGLMKLDPEHVVLDDGKFELLLVPNPKSPMELTNLIYSLLSQKYEENLIFRHVSRLTLDTDTEMPWSLDGEFAPGATHVEIQNIQCALSMLLP